MNCLNCNAVTERNFCPECGQKASLRRISATTVAHDFIHAFTHTDKGFFVLVKELFLRPGTVAREYIEGRRKKYFNPLTFLVITMGIAAYLSYESGYFRSMSAARPTSEQISKMSKEAQLRFEVRNINENEGKLVGLAVIAPILAFLSWLLFRKGKYNYAENFVLAAFLFGLSNVIRVIVFIPLHLSLSGQARLLDAFFQLVFLIYMIVAFRQFFRERWIITVLKSLLVLVLFIVLFWVILFGLAYAKIGVREIMA